MFANTLPLAGLLDGLMIQNTTGWFIVVIQFCLSLAMVAAAIRKTAQVVRIEGITRRFKRDYKSGNDVLSYYMDRRKDERTPLEIIYRAACDRLIRLIQPEARTKMYENSFIPQDAALSPREIALVNASCEQALDEQQLVLDRGMGVISTAVALAPMLGLLGTVWGVLDAFGDMEPGAAMLAKLAPSISSALVTTVIGLLVAIPGVMAYNILSAKIRKLDADMEGFADDVCGRIACEFQGKEI